MSMTVEQMTKVFRLVMDDVELNRLLYYKTDPLSPSHPDVQSLENYYDSTNDSPAIINTIFKRAPKTDDLSDSPLCRMCVYLGNALPKPSNQSAMLLDQDLMIDVFTHINTFEETEFRNLKINDRINKLLFNQNFAGIGKTNSYKRLLITNPPDGYLGYKLIYTFGAMK
ncbi:SPbeta prophage-derived putative protein YomW [Bacillus subtilis]|uniref:Uncharacterized protein n=4 Tax=Bacillus subtilis group TaxID=653685 RepID=A0A9Q4DS65_BACSC|nr:MULTISPECIES: hypothetical protein [Bacillus subtilis group]UAW07842.1 hypothetical protein [Bacillus phage BUCT082]WIT27641.1 hypothetical protein [Bacillus phage SPbetaL5]AWX21945.1 hypothetical protein CXF51_10365 [Bacillus subtilis subsp. subtilis]MBO3794560.1 hypothetical protein [Bacillus subtilis]MBT2165607.1 hypothetical protein [Bacillus subtilis]